MAIELEREVERCLLVSIKRYFEEQLDTEIGDLKATLLLRFILKEIGPCIHNQAIHDAQAHLRDVVEEIDGVCFEPEFGYWNC